MLNWIKNMINWDKYNTPSKLFVYFIDVYGDARWNDEINTCELLMTTIRAVGLFTLVWGFIGVALSVMLWGIIGYCLMIIHHIGFEELLNISDYSSIGVFMITITILGFIFNYLYNYSKNKLYFLQLKKQIKEPSIVSQWYKSVHDKICINIDLTKYRQ